MAKDEEFMEDAMARNNAYECCRDAAWEIVTLWELGMPVYPPERDSAVTCIARAMYQAGFSEAERLSDDKEGE